MAKAKARKNVKCKCDLNPNDHQSEDQQKFEREHIQENGVCSACTLEENENTKESVMKSGEKKPMAYSWSRINSFEKCPFMFKMQYIDKKVTEINPIMVVGRVVHDAINIYNKHCLKANVENDFDRWEECADLALAKENLPEEYYDETLKMIKSYAQSHSIGLESVVGSEEEIAINRKFEQVDWNADDVWFRGIIDYLQIMDLFGKITDYKTGWLMSVPKFQFKIYAWLISKIYPHLTKFEVEIDFVRHEFSKSFHVEADEIPEIEKRLLGKINKIEMETEFEPTVGEACNYCGCWRWCPAMKEKDVVYKVPTTKDEAIKLAQVLEKHNKMRAEVTKILKAYCDDHDRVITGGLQYGYIPTESWEIKDIDTLLVKADEVGLDMFQVLSVDGRKLKKLLKDEKVQKLIQSVGAIKKSVRFTTKKYKAEDDLAPEVQEEPTED